MPYKTPEGKQLLWDARGQQHAHWPIDARGMLRERDPDGTPVYTTEPPEGVTPQLPPVPPTIVGAPKAVTAKVFEGPAVSVAESKAGRVRKAE